MRLTERDAQTHTADGLESRGQTSVAVLVPTYRRAQELKRCLAALRDQTSTPDRVLVVRRPEDEETAEVLRSFDTLPVDDIRVHEGGQVAALNVGLSELREDVVAITDDDGVPWPNWIEQIRRYFARDPALGALGGRDWLYVDGELVDDGPKRQIGRISWYGRFVAFHHVGRGPAREVDFLKGANMSYRRTALDSLEADTLLRGKGAEYNNDWALSLTVKRRGWKVVYDPGVAIDHLAAPRPDDVRITSGRRTSAQREVAAAKAFNETYIAFRHLPALRALAHLPFTLAVGGGQAPGVGIAILRRNRIGGTRTALPELRNTASARLGGAVAGLRARVRDRWLHAK
jgi:GT2 family glycosyltransferase